MSLPSQAEYVIAGAGIHGLPSAVKRSANLHAVDNP